MRNKKIQVAGTRIISGIFMLAIVILPSPASRRQEEVGLYPLKGALSVVTGLGCNVVVYASPEGILVVDSGEKPFLSEKLLSKIREISKLAIRYLVFTHCHHTLGAESFPQTVSVVSHAWTRGHIPVYRYKLASLMERNIQDLEDKVVRLKSETVEGRAQIQNQLDLRKKQLEGIKAQFDALPQITFDVQCAIHLGGQQIELLHFGPGHTGGDALIYFPKEKALAVGDLLYSNGWVPRLDGDTGASVDNWLRIFDRVATMDVEEIIPGHGEVLNKKKFLEISKIFKDYLTDLKAEVETFIGRGASLEKIKTDLRLPKYQKMGMAEILLPWNIEGVYKEIMASKAEREGL